MPPKRAAPAGLFFLILITASLVVAWRFWYLFSRQPVTVFIGKQIAPLYIALAPAKFGGPGGGILFLLPDGSLWRWGVPAGRGSPQSPYLPERMAAGQSWRKIAANWNGVGAIDENRRLFHWGDTLDSPPYQVSPDADWSALDCGWVFYWEAIKTNGSLWAWGDGGLRTNVSEAFSNSLWKAVSCNGAEMLGIRNDGTLWHWNRPDNTNKTVTFSAPIQLSSETNWAGVEGQTAWANNGRVYWPFASTGEKIGATNLVQGRFVLTSSGSYQIRPDGTLWMASADVQGPHVKPPSWHRVGERSDWVAIAGCDNFRSGTFLGLTSDGILWTWGVDWGARANPPLWTRLAQFANPKLDGFHFHFHFAVPSDVHTNPWPLMRLVGTNGS